MNKIIISVLILLLNFFLRAQDLPEIPIKNGKAYYSFDHKLNNTKKCLSLYFKFGSSENSTIQKKIFESTNQISTKKSSAYKSIKFHLVPMFAKYETNCTDTLIASQGFKIWKTGDILWRPAIIEFARKKIISSEINAQVEIIFINKSEYKLVFKDIKYKINWVKGVKNGVDIFKIGELYEQTKSSGKIKKEDIKFFDNLNFFMKTADEIILNALIETYEVDEL